MLEIISFLVAVETLSFWLFILISQNDSVENLRYLPLLIALIIIIATVAYIIKKIESVFQLFGASLIVSLIMNFVYLVLGFLFYPGLVKGVNFFSLKILFGSIIFILLGTLFHFLLLYVLYLVRGKYSSNF